MERFPGHALSQLGFRSVHAPFGLFESVRHEVTSQYDAFTDNPVPLRYQELDRAFPGSKFVHTVRDVEAWLDSVRWLFSEGRRHFNWEAQPVVAEIHEALYGRTTFDEQVFRRRYRRHNEEVIRYFANRPGQFLVMDITKGEGWDALCPFLDVPAPAYPFPDRGAKKPVAAGGPPSNRLRYWGQSLLQRLSGW